MSKLNHLRIKTCTLVATMLLLAISSCKEDTFIQDTNESTPQFKSGIQLSFTQKETSMSTSMSKGELKIIGGVGVQSESKEVNIFFDNKKENYSMEIKRLDGVKRKDFVEPEWKKITKSNFNVSIHDEYGNLMFSDVTTEKTEQDLSFMVTSYLERSKKMREMLEQSNGKSNHFTAEVQKDTNVVKLTQVYDQNNEIDENLAGYTAVSYLNIKYGVSVISKLFDENGELVSKVTMLYRLIDDIPIVAYEEAISYSTDYTGEVIENKTITNYDNINIEYF
ncbi:MAG: hypothetical protein PHE03_12045 [Bacteroidales bacterium]|nr:hypothetical protein [Bacteroidales bacterium]MDD3893022.1 hypothetical protein [Bacteroidales bacterium]